MNVWKEFERLLPGQQRQVVEVVTINSQNRTSTCKTISGNTFVAQGVSVPAGKRAFVVAGRIDSEAPNVPTYEITV
ncbi:hypothetical protein [Parendozoicomonas sp. Alg238-R29]|uniref:hypothetical protein n=1 Tax=Parendozoicomonas sp. Alg238-R29 TaxID=2993446 RepID=UPI00248D6EF9|nr:hypothetical protein [Parendozoicomonas sp. Alg238-R29]